MGKVSLEGLEFFAYHGFYAEEQKTGNKYSVDIQVETSFDKAADEDELSGTVNYEELYEIVKTEMNKPSKLLENIAKRILEAAFNQFPEVVSVEVSISKYNPPIGGICRKAKVTLKEYK